MRMTPHVLGSAAAAAALLIASAGFAQDGAPAAGADASSAPPAAAGTTMPATDAAGDGPTTQGSAPQGAAADPHRLLDEMSGGPQGSPTARRGNPQPGTSTSIPTVNPATVRPLEHRAGNENVAVEDTGFEGQCDPVVSIGCPAVADQLETGATAGAAAQSATDDAAAMPAAEGAAEPEGRVN